jgi:hypothetical protein
MNAAQLKSRSMTLENTASSVFLLKNPSHANAAPQANAESRSSLPRRVEIPGISSFKTSTRRHTDRQDGQTDILSDI